MTRRDINILSSPIRAMHYKGPASTEAHTRLLDGYYTALLAKGVQIYEIVCNSYEYDLWEDRPDCSRQSVSSASWSDEHKFYCFRQVDQLLQEIDLKYSWCKILLSDDRIDLNPLGTVNRMQHYLQFRIVLAVRSLVGENEVLDQNIRTLFQIRDDMIQLLSFTRLRSTNSVLAVFAPHLQSRDWTRMSWFFYHHIEHDPLGIGTIYSLAILEIFNSMRVERPNVVEYQIVCESQKERFESERLNDKRFFGHTYDWITGIRTDRPNLTSLLYLIKVFFYISDWKINFKTREVFEIKGTEQRFLGSLDSALANHFNSLIIPTLMKRFPLHLDLFNFDELLANHFDRAVELLTQWPELYLSFPPIETHLVYHDPDKDDWSLNVKVDKRRSEIETVATNILAQAPNYAL